jgi:hypothetical protein
MSSDLNPTTLRSLQHYASRQTELIDSLLKKSPYLFRDPSNDDWLPFWTSAWGKDLDSLDTTEEVLRGPDPIDNSLILPDVVPDHRDVMLKPEKMVNCWRFECEKIFIRPEYREAEEFVLSICGAPGKCDALIITGTLGTGLSLFYPATTGF